MAIKAALHVPQGDDHPLHVTVMNKSTGLPKNLTGWGAFIVVAPDNKTGTTPLFTYNSTSHPDNISVDSGSGGGISILFSGTDVLVPSEMDPDAYKIKITHPTEAPNGRTVRFGAFIVDDT